MNQKERMQKRLEEIAWYENYYQEKLLDMSTEKSIIQKYFENLKVKE